MGECGGASGVSSLTDGRGFDEDGFGVWLCCECPGELFVAIGGTMGVCGLRACGLACGGCGIGAADNGAGCGKAGRDTVAPPVVELGGMGTAGLMGVGAGF